MNMRQIFKKWYCNLLKFYCSMSLKNSGEYLFIGGFCIFTPKTKIGSYCSFNGIKVLGRGSVSIGDYFHSGSNCQILTENHNISGAAIPYDNTYIIKDVSVGKCVWFGNNVIVLPGVSIGEGAVIQAGSVIVSDIPDFAIAGGHPAHVFGMRDVDHYKALDKMGKYHA
jgi:acetyltransferase-like isoleucine patch superfamily enzyme